MTSVSNSKRFREQTGTLVTRSDGFYIRFYRDSDGNRTKVTERLCDLNTPPKKRGLLQRSHMSAINNARHTALKSPTAEAPAVTVGAFWRETYFPWVQANKRFSTVRGYESTWKIYVKPELETTPISTFTTVDASELLDRMVTYKKLNENTLAHIKSLCSGIFSKACRTKGTGVTVNPWREAKTDLKVRKAKAKVKYTPEETIAILKALDKLDAKLFFALCAVMGMRPSEVAAAKWENITDGVLKIIEAAPYGVLGDTKTERSKRDLTLIEPALSILKSWYEASGKPSSGLIFTNGNGEPANSVSFNKYHIKAQAEKACPRYCGLYAGRHGAATSLYNLTGDIRASYQLLGNSLEVVMSTYVGPDVSAGVAGGVKYADALKAAKAKAVKQ